MYVLEHTKDPPCHICSKEKEDWIKVHSFDHSWKFFFGLNPKAKSKSQQEDDRSFPESGVTVNQIKNPQEGKKIYIYWRRRLQSPNSNSTNNSYFFITTSLVLEHTDKILWIGPKHKSVTIKTKTDSNKKMKTD